MKQAAEIREKAKRARRLGQALVGPDRERLLELAAELEKEAAELDAKSKDKRD